MSRRLLLAGCFLLFTVLIAARSYDWPMWRYDHNRSGSTPEQLPEELFLQWQVKYSERVPVWDDPLNQNLMQFDRLFEPVVYENKMILGFNDRDKVIALDMNSGQELWHYHTGGPVRLPPAAVNGKVFFTSDDGYCYCVDASTGKLVWKNLLAPSSLMLLGNQRMISMWPARGGIAIKDNILYTAASIFPMMGTFIYAIDAETGRVIWKNDGTGSNYILQPHRSPAFAYVAPQGAFTISGNMLLVAGGRTVPAAFDLKTGEEIYYKLSESGKTGGAFTCANDRVFFNHHRERMTHMWETATGTLLKANAGEYPVTDGDTIYFSGKKISASVLDNDNKLIQIWSADIPASNDLIKAGRRLYCADSTGITSVTLSGNGIAGKKWSFDCKENVERIIAASGKLVAVTREGTIMVFGGRKTDDPATLRENPVFVPEKKESVSIQDLTSGIDEGYALIYGTGRMSLVDEILSETSLSVIVMENDNERVEMLRDEYDIRGVLSSRLCFINGGPEDHILPKYFASLILIDGNLTKGKFDEKSLSQIFESLRPYGGRMVITSPDAKHMKMLKDKASALSESGAEIASSGRNIVITRVGALRGSDSWTHAYGNISNTIKSDDILVKAPLGILWFGGNSNLDVLPRHGHGPSEQVIDGRLIIEGINTISARDVYTGRLLWKHEFENLKNDNWLVYYDETYDEENPLDTKYNQVHLPGSNSRGTNYIVTKEYVYVIEGANCHLLDIVTGKPVKTITTGDKSSRQLGYIGVYNDLLILGNNFSDFPDITVAVKEGEKPPDPKFENFDVTASNELVVLDRFSGQRKWSIKANHGFIHNSVIAGDDFLFCLDKLPQSLEAKLRRRGEKPPDDSRLLYIDIRTGKVLHEEKSNIFGSWLGYSSEYRYLLQATRPSRDMLGSEEGKRMTVYNIDNKKIVWDREISYMNPPIIHSDRIYTEGAGYSFLTGEPLMEKDPITGEETKWTFKREYGCGYIVASENLLTFRSASAAFLNLNEFEGTASLGGFKSGCSANLIVADGVLNSPDYTRTCQCPYQNQTSLAFINMPWMNYWTNSNYKWNGNRIRTLGLNLNAPGDRVADNDVLWIDFPNAGGTESGIPVRMDTILYSMLRKDPLSVRSERTPWISSSAVTGVRSMEIKLSGKETNEEKYYTVKLFFAELEGKESGERIFDVRIQGNTVMDNFDIRKESGGLDTELIKVFRGIKAAGSMHIEMIPEKGNTILSGIELTMEEENVIKPE